VVRYLTCFERADQEEPVPLIRDAPWEEIKAFFRQQASLLARRWWQQQCCRGKLQRVVTGRRGGRPSKGELAAPSLGLSKRE